VRRLAALVPRDASTALPPEEKHSVAVHEAGRALVAFFSEHADPVAKITIRPAGRALGGNRCFRMGVEPMALQ
jgi:cell division protease FtsH